LFGEAKSPKAPRGDGTVSVSHDVLKLKFWESMLQTPHRSHHMLLCPQAWRERGTAGCGTFGVFKRLLQTRTLENKVQL